MPITPEDKEELLKDEEFVAKLLARQKPPAADEPTEKPPEKPPDKPKWQRFLETSGGTALITVLIGGALGQLISWSFQQNQKDREFQQKWMEARGAQALVSYKEYLDQEQKLMQRTYELIGNCVAATGHLEDIMRPGFSAKQREEYENAFNAASKEWDGESKKLQLLISYYHKGQKDILERWDELSDAVATYKGCTAEKYYEFKKRPARPKTAPPAAPKEVAKGEESPAGEEGAGEGGPCADLDQLRLDLDASTARFNAALEANRKYPWEGWNSPAQLRNALEETATPAATPTPAPTSTTTPTPEGETAPAHAPTATP